jgi:hypothetical protein
LRIHHLCEAREEEPPWVVGPRRSATAVGHERRSRRRLEQMMTFLAKLADEPGVVLLALLSKGELANSTKTSLCC